MTYTDKIREITKTIETDMIDKRFEKMVMDNNEFQQKMDIIRTINNLTEIFDNGKGKFEISYYWEL